MAWFKPEVVYVLSPEVPVVVVEESLRWLLRGIWMNS